MDKERIEREGWRQASITGGQHLERTVEMYKELGFDVYLEEVKPEECGTCTLCYQAGNETIYRIYTRPKVEEAVQLYIDGKLTNLMERLH